MILFSSHFSVTELQVGLHEMSCKQEMSTSVHVCVYCYPAGFK